MTKTETSEITITNQDTNEVLLFGPIGAFGNDAESIVTKLAATGSDDILVSINSQGGDVTEGLAIANAIKSHQGTVTTSIVGSAFSMASAIAVAGDKRQMAENALFMLHQARVMPDNFMTAEELSVLSGVLEKRNDALLGLYAASADGQTSRDEIKEMMAVQPGTFLTASEAKAVGFVDEITKPKKVAASTDGYEITDLPVRIRRTYQFMFDGAVSSNVTEASNPQAETQPQEVETMTDTQAVVETPAVTTDDIRSACPGATSDFVLEQFDSGADLKVIAAAYSKFQSERIESLEKEIADLKAENIPSKSEAPPAVKAAAEDGELEEIVDGDDPIESYNRTCSEVAEKLNVPLNEARNKVRKQYPQMAAAYVDAMNASGNGAR